jgi:WD40 repeat protein
MVEPAGFDDPAESLPVGSSRARQVVLTIVAGMLVVSMAFLAFVSGRGTLVPPPTGPIGSLPAAISQPTERAPAADSMRARLAVLGADGRLTSMDEFGGSVAPVGTAGARYGFPAWSNDGRRIAAIATSDQDAAVHVFAVGGTPAAPAVVYASADDRPSYVFWAPDDRSVTFLTTDSNGSALRVAPIDAPAAASVVHVGSPMFWTWAGAGRAFVHSGGESPAAYLGEISLGDGMRDRISDMPGGFRAPGISADGTWRAYAVRHDDAYWITVESVDGATRREIPIEAPGALAFDPVGDDLAFVAPTPADGGTSTSAAVTGQLVGPLRIVDPASGILRRLIAGSVVAFDWSPDGQTIAVFQLPTASDRQAVVDDREASVEHGIADVAAGPGRVEAAARAGVRLRLAFVRVEDGTVRSKSMIQVADTFANEFIPAFDQYALSHRIWAPDSSMVALPVVASDGTVNIVEIRPDGSQPRTIAAGVAAFWSR